MDNIFEIVVFFITAIIFIISAVAKQKKKSNGKQTNVGNLVASFFGIPDELKQRPQIIYEEEPNQFEDIKQTTMRNEISSSDEGVDAIPNNEAEDFEQDDTTQIDFDLRKAVIYSEILNRKEY
ncbi:MAG: hypothetical protein PF517_09775 [Salinivirgaceae bacterium]|jgi:hypothetical protein|nr:hypothetical protein [Salinivirgaceae bacterium]